MGRGKAKAVIVSVPGLPFRFSVSGCWSQELPILNFGEQMTEQPLV